MKKYLAITLVIVALLAAIGWYLRNSLIQRITGPILAEYDIEIVDVSLDALATNDATIGYLELVHAKGTTVTIEGLTLPIGAADDGIKVYAAEKVSIITATRIEGEAFELARLIDQFLSLPDRLGGSKIIINEFKLAPYPAIRQLNWTINEGNQLLNGVVETIEFAASLQHIDSSTHSIAFVLPDDSTGADAEQTIHGKMARNDGKIVIKGESDLGLPRWEDITKFAGIVPVGIGFDSGTTKLEYDVAIPFDASQSPALTATMTPTSPLRLDYTVESGDLARIEIRNGAPVEINATFPDGTWRLKQADASLLVNYEDWHDVPVSIEDLSCQAGPDCTVSAKISMTDADLPFGTVEQLNTASVQKVTFPPAGLRVELQPGASLLASGVNASGTEIATIAASLISTGELELVDAGWRISAESVDASIDSFVLTDGISASAPLFLEAITIDNRDDIPSAQFGLLVPAVQVAMNLQTIALPGLRGTVSRQNDDVEFGLSTVDLFQDGTIEGRYELDAGNGEITIADTAISFGANKLSNRTSPWNRDWDLIGGVAAVDGQASWGQAGADLVLNGQASVKVTDFSGFYSDSVFAGLSTRIEASYDNERGLGVQPSRLSIALVETGLPIENISADYSLASDLQGANVENLRMAAFGGIITADPFSFHTDNDSNTVILKAESMEISDILTLKEFDALRVSGRIGAELPITITQEGITVAAGTLTGEAPGGVIRYTSGDTADKPDTSSIGLVKEALSHFKYDTLTSEVSYNRDGDLELQMQLNGRNPDMEGSRPVILNLNVENNVPQMLKSLQAARAVEEILERHLAE